MNEPTLGPLRSRLTISYGSRARRLRVRHVFRCSYFPHHRLHLLDNGGSSPSLARADAARGISQDPSQAPEPISYTAQQLSALVNPVQLHLAYSSLLALVQPKLQALCKYMAQAIQQLQALWAYVVMNWPAWQASLIEDAEYVVYYAVGVIPAWLISLHAAVTEACVSISSAPPVQRAVTTAAYAARDFGASLHQLRQSLTEIQMVARTRLADSPPLQQLHKLGQNALSRGSDSSNIARSLTQSMAALTAADLAADGPVKQSRTSKRSRSSGNVDHGAEEGCDWLVDFASADSRAAASSGLQRMVIEPLMRAGFISNDGRSPTLAGTIAAASVLLAGSVYRSMRHNAQAAEERLLQQVQLQLKAENLAAQRARFRRALGDAQAAAANGAAPAVRRRAASPPEDDAWEDNTPASQLAPAGPAVRSTGNPRVTLPQLDADAAREYQRFMAGAKAMDVPMWDTHMVEELPKVSMKELQRQTQKIRAAATADERAAMEDAETRRQIVEQQLNSQLQELSGAPIGRAAREAWRKEQQQLKLQEQQAQTSKAAAGSSVPNSNSNGRDSSDSNPFAIPKDARAKWEAEDHMYSDVQPKAKSRAGWGFGFGSKQQQQQPEQTVQQQVRRRRFADDAEKPAAEQAFVESSSSRNSSAPKASVFGSVLDPPSSKPAVSDRQQPLAVEVTAPEAEAAGPGPAEGTPEWEAHMREEMLRSGAARRARRQQMMQQQAGTGPAAVAAAAALPAAQQQLHQQAAGVSASTSVRSEEAAAARRQKLPEQSLRRPEWPGAAAGGSRSCVDGHRLTVLGRDVSSSGRLSTASARDVQDITADPAGPSPGDVHRMETAAASRAEAAAEARAAAARSTQHQYAAAEAGAVESVQQGEDDDFNPFAVDRDAVLDDETAFELGKRVDQETKRIKLQF